MTLVTIDEAARHAVVHPQTVRRWVREGRLQRIGPWVMLSQVLTVERDRRHARHAGNRGPRLTP